MNEAPNVTALDLDEIENQRDVSDAIVALMRNIGEAGVPMSRVERLSDGANPVLAWREYCGLTSAALTEMAGVSEPDLARVEAGEELGLRAMARIARRLRVDLDDLVPWSQD